MQDPACNAGSKTQNTVQEPTCSPVTSQYMQDPPCLSSLSLRERLSHFGRPQGLLRWDPPPESPWVENRRGLFASGSASTAYRELGSSHTSFPSSLESPQALERIALDTPQANSRIGPLERIALGTPQVDTRFQATPLPEMRDGRLDPPARMECAASAANTWSCSTSVEVNTQFRYHPSSADQVQEQVVLPSDPAATIARLRSFVTELQQKLVRDSALSAELRKRVATLEADGKAIRVTAEALEERIAQYGNVLGADPELQNQLRNEDARGAQLRRRIAQLEGDREQAHRRIQFMQRQNMDYYQTIQSLINREVTVP